MLADEPSKDTATPQGRGPIVIVGCEGGDVERILGACRDVGHRVVVVQYLARAVDGLPLGAELVILEEGQDEASRSLAEAACRALRSRGDDRHTLVVSDQPNDVRESLLLAAGADYYLAPFAAARLGTYVSVLVARVRENRAARIVVGTLALNRASRDCELQGQQIALTAKEFDILFHLAKQPDFLVSSREIARDVLDCKDTPSTRACIRQHIYALRRKNPILARLLRTVRGEGYVLEQRAAPAWMPRLIAPDGGSSDGAFGRGGR